MLKTTYFAKGENETQFYYFFSNEATQELVQIIRNKREKHWFGMYDDKKADNFFIIPVYTSEDENTMLKRVCDWYNNGKKERYYAEEVKPTAKNISKTIQQIEDMYGTFSEDCGRRLQSYIDNPSVERWDDIQGIIVDGWKTVWQLVLEVDSTFPRQGRSTDITGKVVKEWERIPDALLVMRAVKRGVEQKGRRDKR